jgi:hypothetical protein
MTVITTTTITYVRNRCDTTIERVDIGEGRLTTDGWMSMIANEESADLCPRCAEELGEFMTRADERGH